MPIFKWIAFGAALILAGCAGLDENVTRPAPERVSVADNQVVIAGPAGFCVDPDATRDNGDAAFVLLGNCAAISNAPFRPQPDVAAVLTATVATPAGPIPDVSAMSRYFRSEAGRAALSASGDANSVEILEMRETTRGLYLHARDRDGGPRSLSADYWRGILKVNDKIVTVALRGLENQSASDAAKFRTLDVFAARILAENRRSQRVAARNLVLDHTRHLLD